MKTITADTVFSLLPKREPTFHKGNFGRVLVVAGSRGMCGAGFLCALSALRVGAGLVAWALPKSMQPAFASSLPEAITVALPETPEGLLALEAKAELKSFCAHFKPSVIACGPGMGNSPLLPFILEEIHAPLVLDADALNFLAGHSQLVLPQERPCIYTPHPGEMARLLQSLVATSEKERLDQLQSWASRKGAVTVLKGHETLVYALKEIWKNTSGSVALAKGGAGDVLTGVITGLWSQLGAANGFTDLSASHAALCGVYLHGLAGTLAAQKQTTYGVLAREIAQYIPAAIGQVLKTGGKR